MRNVLYNTDIDKILSNFKSKIKMTHIKGWDLNCSEITKNLYIGRASFVSTQQVLEKNLTLIIWATPEIQPPELPVSLNFFNTYKLE